MEDLGGTPELEVTTLVTISEGRRGLVHICAMM